MLNTSAVLARPAPQRLLHGLQQLGCWLLRRRKRALTTEDVEDQGSRLAAAGLVVAHELYDLARLFDLIIVLFEVDEQLARAVVQGQGALPRGAVHLVHLAHLLRLWRALDLRPQACARQVMVFTWPVDTLLALQAPRGGLADTCTQLAQAHLAGRAGTGPA